MPAPPADAAGEEDDEEGAALGEEAAPGVPDVDNDLPRPAPNPLPPSGPLACWVK